MHYIVFNEGRREGVVFTDKQDAEYAATGAMPVNFYSTVADNWREVYAEDEPSKVFEIIEIDIPA